MLNVLIADDHEVTRRGIREILRDAFEEVNLAEAVDGLSLIELLRAQPWDLILLDIMMPNSDILDTLAHIRELYPSVPVLVLTAVNEVEYVVQCMEAGANGLIHKHRASDELLDAIRNVLDGRAYLHAETALAIASSSRMTRPELPHEALSDRELEIFRLIALGRAVKEVAGDLGISDKTVATYLSRIREKTGLTSHVEIARYALQHGLVEMPSG